MAGGSIHHRISFAVYLLVDKEMDGKNISRRLLGNAGVLDIARDPWYCGGEEKAERILAGLNQHVFDGMLQLE